MRDLFSRAAGFASMQKQRRVGNAQMNSPVFAFDAYGTLFDVHAAIEHQRHAIGPDARQLSETWRNKQLEYTWTLTLAGRYVDFWTVTVRALDQALARFPTVDAGLRNRLLESYMTLDAFPDARKTLNDLKKRGLRTAILSNGSPSMLTAAVESAQLADSLDEVLSADAVHLYKPHPDVYRLATDAFGVAPSEIVFVSSNRWDIMGAAVFGFRTVWLNRDERPDEYVDLAPSVVLTNLAGVAALEALARQAR